MKFHTVLTFKRIRSPKSLLKNFKNYNDNFTGRKESKDIPSRTREGTNNYDLFRLRSSAMLEIEKKVV